MGFPQLGNKYKEKPFVLHTHLMTEKVQTQLEQIKLVILLFDQEIAEKVAKAYKGKRLKDVFAKCWKLKKAKGIAIVSGFGIGGPAVATTIEYFRLANIGQFIMAGYCGLLPASNRSIGDLFIPSLSVRDEGTSFHYAKESAYIENPEGKLTNVVKNALRENGIAFHELPNVSTDAPFFISKKEINYYSMLNVHTIDMETSSIYSVGVHYRMDICSLLVASDKISENGEVHPNKEVASEAIIQALKALVPSLQSYVINWFETPKV